MNRLNKEAHAIEEINGIRCAVVEKNVSPERVDFLKKLLEFNGYTVQTAAMPPPKGSATVTPKTDEGSPEPIAIPAPPALLIIGVTNIIFHPMLAIYERALKTPEGKTASIAYWNQEPEKEKELYWQRRIQPKNS
jgi:hypothetical protein